MCLAHLLPEMKAWRKVNKVRFGQDVMIGALRPLAADTWRFVGYQMNKVVVLAAWRKGGGNIKARPELC